MRTSRNVASLVVALSMTAAVVVGCSGPAIQSGPAPTPSVATTGSVSAPDTSSATASPPAAPSSSASGLSVSDLRRMRAQLDAMQKEINSIQMPTDDDFNSAEGELY